jgi:serine/threonine protein kinase/Tfp pilus assembly protein PilF
MTEPSLPQESIFLQALEIRSVAQRAAYLDRACGENRALRAEVEGLLRAHDHAGDLLDLPEQPAGTVDEPITERPGMVLGPYKLLEQIGEGGFGVVFMAEQQHPLRRRVALKVLKPGMDTRQVVARFETERQALALMDHPNIAKVLDAGETAAGRPYFVMELVRGVPITAYCDQNQLTPPERLELAIHVCRAVQHAHHKGVIHRDLKPSNILVTLHDGVPVPKVIDFGIAKATGPQLTEKTLFTNFAQLIGTPLYMSPEQAELSGLDVDTRSDVYSLGVLLYELLTGTTPFDKERFRAVGYDEMRRIIREEEPPRPSARLSTLGPAATVVSGQRKSDPKKLSQLFRGEVDWIVMKCLEKDRNRRYETANGLARDLERYLADEPVQACPPSAAYRLRKFARRNKVALAAAGLVATTLVLIVAVLAVSNVQIRWEKQQKEDALERAQQKTERALKAEALAKSREKKERTANEAALAMLTFFRSKVLAAARPRDQMGGLGVEATIRAAVDAAEPQVTDAFRDQPLVEAAVRDTIGQTYHLLGEPELAIRQYARALALHQACLGPNDPLTLSSLIHLGKAYSAAERPGQAIPLLEQALERSRVVHGPEHEKTLETMYKLSTAYAMAGKAVQALTLAEQTVKLAQEMFGSDDQLSAMSLDALGSAYLAAGKPNKALPVLEEVLKKCRSSSGPNHPTTLRTMNNMGLAYLRLGKPDRAGPLLRECFEKTRDQCGPSHPKTLTCMNLLGHAYRDARKFDQAVPLLEEALRLCKLKLGLDSRLTLDSEETLAFACQDSGRPNRAVPLLEELLRFRKARLGPDHLETLRTMTNLASAYQDAGKLDLALALYEEALKPLTTRPGPDDPQTLKCMWSLAAAYRDAGRPDKAVTLQEKVLKWTKRKLGPDHPETILHLNNLGTYYRDAGRLDEAAAAYRDAVAAARRNLGSEDAVTGQCLLNLGDCYCQLHQPATAEPLLREGLAICRKRLSDTWVVAVAQGRLGRALLGQQKLSEAEPLLLAGYRGLIAAPGKAMSAPERRRLLIGALEGLVQLYDVLGQPEEAGAWAAKLRAEKKNHKAAGP